MCTSQGDVLIDKTCDNTTTKSLDQLLSQLKVSTEKVETDVVESLEYINKFSTDHCPDKTYDYLYNEILHHLHEIQHHVQQIHYHHSKIIDIGKPPSDDEKIPKPEEMDTRSKCARKALRTSSMKYLEQWERMVEAQKLEAYTENLEEGPPLLPKPVIVKRVRQFEGKDKKRASSTVDAFLDVEDCYRIQETLLEEDEEEDESTEKNYICEESKVNNDNITVCDSTILQEFSNNNSINKPTTKVKPRIVDVVYKLTVPSEEAV